MRTKTFLLTAAVFAAGLGASVAQSVYSVNAVGYVNLALPAGNSLIANPLNGTNNLLNTVIPVAPDFSQIYKFDPATQLYLGSSTFLGGSWDVNYTLAPGEGAFIILPSAATITFVGEVPQGNLATPLSSNYQIASSQVPQAGALTATLGYPAQDFDQVFKYDRVNQRFSNSYNYLGGWDPADPPLEVGESVFIQRTASGSWTRAFSVN